LQFLNPRWLLNKTKAEIRYFPHLLYANVYKLDRRAAGHIEEPHAVTKQNGCQMHEHFIGKSQRDALSSD